jgi:AcrR family transcriptional regulator
MARGKSSDAHNRVILAALALFGKHGIEATSMDAIARIARVSKATIYNHWEHKEQLLMEVMVYIHGLDDDPIDADTGDLTHDIATVLSRRPSPAFQMAREHLTPSLIAYSATHQEFGQAWRYRVMEPPRQCLERILKRGIERGQLPPDLNLELSMALLLGPMLYRHIFSKRPHREEQDIGAPTAAAFVRAHAIGKALETAIPEPRKTGSEG